MDDFNNDRKLVDIIAEMKKEFQEFIQTRLELFRRELREKVKLLKFAVPLAGISLVLAVTAYLLLTAAVVSLVVVAFEGSLYRWFFGFLLVGVVWAVLAGVTAFLAKRQFDLTQLMPKKTIEVLKGDKFWIQQETKKSDYEQRAS